jgi:hypothetical protein
MGKNRQNPTQAMMGTNATVKDLTIIINKQ